MNVSDFMLDTSFADCFANFGQRRDAISFEVPKPRALLQRATDSFRGNAWSERTDCVAGSETLLTSSRSK